MLLFEIFKLEMSVLGQQHALVKYSDLATIRLKTVLRMLSTNNENASHFSL